MGAEELGGAVCGVRVIQSKLCVEGRGWSDPVFQEELLSSTRSSVCIKEDQRRSQAEMVSG